MSVPDASHSSVPEDLRAGAPELTIPRNAVFPKGGSGPFLEIPEWSTPITFFVGRNGTGKSRTAAEVAKRMNGRRLSTDRLVGLMSFSSYSWGTKIQDFKGVPLSESDRSRVDQTVANDGLATSDLYALREQPEVALRVSAFIRRALHRDVEVRESSGYLDPHIRFGGSSYSLLRDEGHGLRELVVLLLATYRNDTSFLVVDEPELHLHPAMVRLWLAELRRECVANGKKALIVTHDPGLVQPRTLEDLKGIYHFDASRPPVRLADSVLEIQRTRVETSLAEYPSLVSDLVFSPRPVLVEGPTDVAALQTALRRLFPHEVVEQTDLVPCGNSHGVATWFEVSNRLGLDVRAVVDLDAIFTAEVQRVLDSSPAVRSTFEKRLMLDNPRVSEALRPLIDDANHAQVKANPKARAEWLSDDENLTSSANVERKRFLLEVARDHGIWHHSEGTLENVLGTQSKDRASAIRAASVAGPIDQVADWAAYELDPAGEVKTLLSVAVVRICQAIQQAQLLDPAQVFSAPVGPSAPADARLVAVSPLERAGFHRARVLAPASYADWFVDFDVNTPAPSLVPRAPDAVPSADNARVDD